MQFRNSEVLTQMHVSVCVKAGKKWTRLEQIEARSGDLTNVNPWERGIPPIMMDKDEVSHCTGEVGDSNG